MEILAKELIYSEINPIYFVSAAILLIIIIVLKRKNYLDSNSGDYVLLILTIAFIFTALLGVSEINNRETYVTYYATIKEDYSLTEFYNNYEILDVNGKLFHIKEKD